MASEMMGLSVILLCKYLYMFSSFEPGLVLKMKWMCFYMELQTKSENCSENVSLEKVNHLVKMNLKKKWKLS